MSSQQNPRMPGNTDVEVKVWDLPVRLFHWAIVVLFSFQLVTGWMGGSVMSWHVWSGYSVLVLVVFRILWGFAGSTHARFASFIAGPAATLHFAKRLFSREAVPQVGHNPLGGWMVIALVVSLALQAGTGLFANDGLATEGPLAALVSLDVSNTISTIHRGNLKVLLALSVLHITGVLFHLIVKRENLIGAMFTGVKRVPEAAVHERRDASRDSSPRRVASRESASVFIASLWRALALFLVALAVVYLVVQRPF
jgi:cytochrome b